MSKFGKIIKNNSYNIHRDSDGSWGTDDHDGDILKGLAALVAAIGTTIATIASTKKK